jgi:hypothetical protein
MQFGSFKKEIDKYNMPPPLQTVITLQLYYHSYTYINLIVRKNEKNEKAAAERRTNSAALEKINFSN